MSLPFAEYRGTAYLDKVDPDQRAALYAWQEVLRLGQGTLVDGEYVINSQIYLCRATADYLYSRYSPTKASYKPGSRPFLEKVVKGLGIMGRSDFEKFLWLARFVRDLPDARGWDLGKQAQDGGTEEELIEKRVAVCNEQARLMVTLCQAAGLPARYIGHHIGGHGVTEVYVDGHWGYHDVRGKFFLRKNGRMASTWEIWQDPGIIRRQPEWVTREVHPRYWYQGDPYAMTEMAYFHPQECTGVVNYFIADHRKFDYARDWPMTGAARARVRELVRQRNGVRRKFKMYHTEAFTAKELRELFGVFRNGRWSGGSDPDPFRKND